MKLSIFAIMERKIVVHSIPYQFRMSFCEILKCLRGIEHQSNKILNSVKHLNNPSEVNGIKHNL